MSSGMSIARRMILALFKPAALADEIEGAREGAIAVVALGVAWGLFSLWLFLAGHGPSFTLVPIPKSHYYLAQAFFVVPLCLVLWQLMSWVALAVAGARERRALTMGVLAYVYAAPLLFSFVLVDVVIFSAFGFEAMGRYLRFYAPLAPLWTLVGCTVALRRALSISLGRALVAAFAGLAAQAVAGGILLR